MNIEELPPPIDLGALGPDVAYNTTAIMRRLAVTPQLAPRDLLTGALAGALRPLSAAMVAAVLIGFVTLRTTADPARETSAAPSLEQLLLSAGTGSTPDVAQLLDAWGN
jgi:hypothetical protein